jgi:hypothetical protein
MSLLHRKRKAALRRCFSFYCNGDQNLTGSPVTGRCQMQSFDRKFQGRRRFGAQRQIMIGPHIAVRPMHAPNRVLQEHVIANYHPVLRAVWSAATNKCKAAFIKK